MKDPQLERILADPRLAAEILALHAGPQESLESVGGRSAESRLRRLLEDEPGLEKIIRAEGRPVLLVRNGTFEVPSLARWRGPLEAARPRLERAIRAVGRLELRDHPDMDWAGTAWLVGDRLAVTNRHVAELFARSDGGRFVFRRGPHGRLVRASVDLRREHASDETLEVAVEDIVYLAPDRDDAPDLAVVRLAASATLPEGIPLSSAPIVEAREVAAIGYPARDDYEDANLQGKVFGAVYDVKRLAPGEVMGPQDGLVFTHDCSTLGGNSGSVVVDLQTGEAVGLHFSGTSGKANYAVRAAVVRAVLDATQQRVSVSVARPDEDDEAKKPKIRPASFFQGRTGYEPAFLGSTHEVPVPALTGSLADDFSPADGVPDGLLRYTHFSIAMSRSRRMALYTAVNIDGRQLRRKVRKDDAWYLDGRLPVEAQVGEAVYSKNKLDRGHLVRRLDPVWGDPADQADEDTFHLTNASPQHQDLNQKTWLSLEDYVLENADVHDLKVSVFSGPVLKDDDRDYRDVKLPERFWKVVTMVREPEQELLATAYVLTQRHLLTDLEFVFGAFRTYQVPVAMVESLTGLDFGRLRDHDPLAGTEGPSVVRRIEERGDLVLRRPARREAPATWASLWDAVESGVKAGDAAAEARAVAAIEARVRAGDPMPAAVAVRGLNTLRKQKRFRRLVDVADLTGAFDAGQPALRKVAIQGLIDDGRLDRAIQELEKTRRYIVDQLAAAASGSLVDAEVRLQLRPEQAEVEGLLGRVYKQRCVDRSADGPTPPRREDALRSLAYYGEAYKIAPVQNLWHGVNYVAMSRYTERNLPGGVPGAAPDEVAREILRTIEYLDSRGLLTVWDLASRGEAALAASDLDQARQAYAAYLAHPDVDAFMRGSSLRQLEQVWQLPASHPLVQLFTGEVAAVEAGQPKLEDVQLQARFKDAPYDSPEEDALALSRARSVARIGTDLFVGEGTGFLFDGAAVSAKLSGRPLLLTCAHVCPGAVRPEKICVIFFGPGDDVSRKIIVEYAQTLWSSPVNALDATLLLLGAAPFGVIPAPLATGQVQVGDRAYIIGHPLGGAKLASLRNNDVREVEDNVFYYNSAADPGSSGSPVFNNRWELTGMHRAGVQSKELNQGKRLDRILAALRAHPW